MKAIIRYKSDAQKQSGYYDRILTQEVLDDICWLTTGTKNYEVIRECDTYNKGRLIIIEYKEVVYYVTLSELVAEGRNSSVQSVPTALNLFYAENSSDKKLCYYFMKHTGNLETDYHHFIYRLMLTADFKFLNAEEYLSEALFPFISIKDIISQRDVLQHGTAKNNSTYITRSTQGVTQIYGKTYGANKYETTLICVAISCISTSPIELFNICEQDLKCLPSSSIRTIEKLGKVTIIDTNLKLEKKELEEQKGRYNLRFPIYTYNLLRKLGAKRCALCHCEIPELIQGAHIWSIANIKKSLGDEDSKIEYATNGDNGLWLCMNHHKLFDENMIQLDLAGKVQYDDKLMKETKEYIDEITSVTRLPEHICTGDFQMFLKQRYRITVD